MTSLVRSLADVGTRQAWDTPETAALIRIGIVVILAVLVIGRVVDWRRRRVEEAMALRGVVADALMNEPGLAWTTVTTEAHAPILPGGPTTLEIAGSVPSPEAREAAVRTTLRVLADQPHRVSLEDRLWVDPAPLRLAA